jgi:Flp pilus assembly pilin Flp
LRRGSRCSLVKSPPFYSEVRYALPNKDVLKACEFQKGLTKGQTMTEYAMILAAIAIAVFVTYELMGQDINHLATWGVDNDFVSAAS